MIIMPLTNNQQAVAVLVSALLIGIGAVAVPAGANVYVALALEIVGATGLALKEALGSV